MMQGLADTSFFLAQEAGRPIRRDAVPERLGVSVVTIGELRAGVLSAADVETRDRRLVTLTIAMALEPRPVDGRIADAWARLRMILRRDNLRMPINDSWIAATAMSLGVPVVTQDQDFVEVEGLSVVHV